MASQITMAQGIETPRASPKASVTQIIGVCTVTVNYSRPSVRNRKIFGDLVPYGKVWRAGANEATTISFNYPIQIGGKQIPSGTYGLFMIPNEQEWTIILNKDWNQWGAYNYNEADDIVRVGVVPKNDGNIEMCIYSFVDVDKTKGVLRLQWENVKVDIEIGTETHDQTLLEIDRVTKSTMKDWFNFSAAAQYHFYEHKDAENALKYINIAIALQAPNPAPWMLKSQILAYQKKYGEAIELAKEALVVAKKYNFHFEIEENEAHIKQWGEALKN